MLSLDAVPFVSHQHSVFSTSTNTHTYSIYKDPLDKKSIDISIKSCDQLDTTPTMLELLPVCMCRLTAGGGRDAPRERGNIMLWGRLRMPLWVGVEAVWGTITNSSSEGANILAKLRLCERNKYRKTTNLCVIFIYMNYASQVPITKMCTT